MFVVHLSDRRRYSGRESARRQMYDGVYVAQRVLAHRRLGDVAADDFCCARPLGHGTTRANGDSYLGSRVDAASFDQVLEESSAHVAACTGQQHAS